MTTDEFCNANGLKSTTFRNWKKLDKKVVPKLSVSFVPVKLKAASPIQKREVPKMTLSITSCTEVYFLSEPNPFWLATLLRELR